MADHGALQVESTMSAALKQGLADKGHHLKIMPAWSHESGAGQIAMRQRDSYVAASDGRRDRAALVG